MMVFNLWGRRSEILPFAFLPRRGRNHGTKQARSLTPPEHRGIFLNMSSVKEIESAIEHLPATDFFKLGEWFDERREQLWDDHIANDAKSGRLDFLIEEARTAKKSGTLRPFP